MEGSAGAGLSREGAPEGDETSDGFEPDGSLPPLCFETVTQLDAVPDERPGFVASPPALVARAVGSFRSQQGDTLVITQQNGPSTWIERTHNPAAGHIGSTAPECPSELRVPVREQLETHAGDRLDAVGYLKLDPKWDGWLPAQLVFDAEGNIKGQAGVYHCWGRLEEQAVAGRDGVPPEQERWRLLIRSRIPNTEWVDEQSSLELDLGHDPS